MSRVSPTARVAAGLLALPALALPALASGLAPASAADGYDPVPLAHGTTWLAGQLTNGVIHNDQYDFDDLGLSVDTGLALAAVGDGATVDAISGALAPQVASYYSYDVYNSDFSQQLGTHVTAGSLAKAAVFARTAGDDPRAYGGHDLIALLQDRVPDTGSAQGRIGDVVVEGGSFESDFANTFGQAFAVKALDDAGSVETDAATEFLLDQQCGDGYFRQALGATTSATCDADAGKPSVDATALAVLNLVGQADDTTVQDAITAAVTWLQSVQHEDGSFASDGEITTPNANSTGLAGWALGGQGLTSAASDAAAWLRAHQADDFGPCTSGLTAQTGAIAYDDAGLAAGRSDGIVKETRDQFRRATAQALPALQWAPLGAYSSEPTSDSAYVRAGSTQRVVVESVAPGQTVCFARGASQDLVSADLDGTARGRVPLPEGSGVRTYSVGLTDGVYGHISFRALAAKKLEPEVGKAQVRQGRTVRVTVAGLSAGEHVTVLLRGDKVAAGKVNREGGFRATITVPKKARTGKATVVVTGEFGNRRGTTTFRVTKG